MKRTILGFVVGVLIMLTFKYCGGNDDDAIVLNSSGLIQEQLKNISKLVVTEGQYSEVFNYKNSKEIFGDFLRADKKALVIVNSKATISYDLNQVEYEVDEATKTVRLTKLPKPEINVAPDFEYYDIQADFLNPFEAEDYNAIKNTVKASLLKKVENSSLVSNAENRLISELGKFLIVTRSLGWTLTYKKETISTSQDLERLLL
ncbi:DUF4230 domain-containing protein [Winogradskyella maritima]|uniref:DUF4230 domain-containing protein n=1 Tax=Winogradskyella maritima TaxID=1517766 RepID=A0ABV8AJF7_9FLAO|nr:DUF4230 domain-containing protein [Winogradskyella maritima]